MTVTLLEPRRRNLGRFEVGRVLPSAARHMVGPFVFFDHLGPVQLERGLSREADVRPHPHIGLATVTYLFEGEIVHRDSTGITQAIRPGEVNWMTAGRGITHSERFEQARREGGPMHAIQSWVALPREREEVAPAFAHYGTADLPQADEPGLKLRLLAGEAYGLSAPVPTLSPLFYVHAAVAAGTALPWPPAAGESALYVVAGALEAGALAVRTGQMLVINAEDPAPVLRAALPSVVMLLGGEPVGPRFLEWNFVSSSRARIEQAKADWRAGRLKLPDADNQEFIPLPPDPPPAAGAMS